MRETATSRGHYLTNTTDATTNNESAPLEQLMAASLANYWAAADLYARLLNFAPNDFHAEFLQYILADETGFYNTLTDLYVSLFGTRPIFDREQIAFTDYRDGLYKAIKAELNMRRYDYEILNYLSEDISNLQAANAYRLAASGHNEHLSLITMLYNLATSVLR
ncbi:MAG: hypothetical protein GX572_04540 [Clostridia bacterium]|nr:hypothetical protein [Clostridia bacterium]